MDADKLSLDPDENMKWIYDVNHPDYYGPRAVHLREARAAALRSAPKWLLEFAESNDSWRRIEAERDKPK